MASAQHPLACPRCESVNTKFCYYNNYNHSQPRHFCKACRRYWTHGGSLRNIPMGGQSRKNSNRSRNSASAPSAAIAPPGSTCSRQGKQSEEADWIWSGLNMNEVVCSSFTSLTSYGFGLGLMPGFNEFGMGGVRVGGDFVNSASELVNVDPTSSEKWHDCSGRVDMSDWFGWPDLSISVPGNDLVD